MGGSGESFMGRHFWTLFGAIWLGVGLPLLIIGLSMWWQSSRYGEEGVHVEGMVLSRDVIPASGRQSTRYRVRYRFRTREGATYENTQNVDVEVWEKLQERGPVEVEYLHGSPRSNRVAGQSGQAGVLVFSLLGGFFSFAGGGLLVFSLVRVAARRRILRIGTPAEAVVLAVEQTNLSVNRVRQWRLRYRYRDVVGMEHEGKSGYLSPETASSWSQGDTCQVKYDPRRPEKSAWLG